MSNEITQKPKSDVATYDPAFDQVGGTGFENVKPTDLLIPRLTILQALSPTINPDKPEYDPEARIGEIYDLGMQERFPEGVEVIVAHYKKIWAEWPAQRGSGKRPIEHDTDAILDECHEGERGAPTLKNGNTIAETAQFYVINLSTPDRRKSFIPMASTQIKKARRLLTLAQSERIEINGVEKTPPLFWRSYFLTTVSESNAMGSWKGWKVERGPELRERDNYKLILKEVKDLRDDIVEGRARGDMGGEDTSERPF